MWDSRWFHQHRGPRLADCLDVSLFEFRLDDRPRYVPWRGWDGISNRDLDVFDKPRDRAFRIIGSGAGTWCE